MNPLNVTRCTYNGEHNEWNNTRRENLKLAKRGELETCLRMLTISRRVSIVVTLVTPVRCKASMSTEGDSRLVRLALSVRSLRLPFHYLPPSPSLGTYVGFFFFFKLMLLVTQENFTPVLLLGVPRV